MDAWCSRVPQNQSLLRYCTRGFTNMTLWTATFYKVNQSHRTKPLTGSQQPHDRTLHGLTVANHGDQHSLPGFQGPRRQAPALHEQRSQSSSRENSTTGQSVQRQKYSTHHPGPFEGSPVHLTSIPLRKNFPPRVTSWR